MTTELHERLTGDVAQARGLVPVGYTWDEEAQQPIPRGDAMVHAVLSRPVDLARNLAEWQANRDTLVRFIEGKLLQAEYDAKGYPLPGKMHDYYKLPQYDKRVLTKQGAEKLAQLFRFARASTETVQREATKEGALAVVRVVLTDHYRRPVGSGEAACSTAEKGFQGGAAMKYGGDYRAALNDVIARAGKRAFVQAVVYAIAGDELFDAQPVIERDDEDERRDAAVAAAPSGYRFPPKWKDVGGKLVTEVSVAQLTKVADWCRNKASNPKAVEPVLQACETELERRRVSSDEDGPR